MFKIIKHNACLLLNIVVYLCHNYTNKATNNAIL